MENQELHDKLKHLHSELQKVQPVDDKDKEWFKQFDEDSQNLLNADKNTQPPPSKRLGETLRNGIDRFEASHPDLTMIMGELAEMLSNMGI